MSELLTELAEKLGIKTSFTYGNGNLKTCYASDSVLRCLIKDLGYNATDDKQIENSLTRIEKKRWQSAMEPIYVVQQGKIFLDVVLTEKENEFELCRIDNQQSLHFNFEETERKTNGRTTYVRYKLSVTDDIEIGYYELELRTKKHVYKTTLAVAPHQCYELNKNNKEKLFGFAIQLYSLKSYRNWGIGDFTDLENVAEILADNGGDVIGLNPLNVLLHDYPENASPYASISRLFLNPIYIDMERVPFYEEKFKDEETIRIAKEKEHIDYTVVYTAKIKALREIFAQLGNHRKSDYYRAFEKFKKNDEGELYRLALFETISEAKNTFKAKKLPKTAIEIEKFAEDNKKEVDFFMFLQFEADRQLQEVYTKIKERNMAIGLYRDLPVGVSKDSAEVWGDKYLYMQESGAGAPPDNYFPTGQKWGLGAFNPFELKARGYKPFIQILRANMRYAGAIRIDHVMGLSRLYLIPDKEKEGTYLSYNAEDMFNLLALESYLNKCVVVGECIGNVEAGFTEMLEDRNIYALGVLWGERSDANGTMSRPHEYKQKYFASVGTHDMPPLKAWWFGKEIGLMNKLGLFTAEETQNSYHWREHERTLLLQALDGECVWPQDNYRKSDYHFGEGYPEGIEEAVHAYMAKTNSEVFMMQPEDIFQSDGIQNLPGTDIDKYPNWRTKLPIEVENIRENPAFCRHIGIVKKYR